MYKHLLVILLVLSFSSFAKEEPTKYPYLELQQVIYQYHLNFNPHKWESINLFDSFFKKLDPYKIVFNEEELSDISHLRLHFYGVILDDDIRNKTLTPVYEHYKKANKKFLDTIKEEIKNIDIEYFKNNSVLFEIKPENYPFNYNKQRQRIKNFLYNSIINEVIDKRPINEIKEELLSYYNRIPEAMDYNEFNFLLLDVIAEAMDPHSTFFSPIEQQNFKLDFQGVLNGGLGISFDYDKLGQPKIAKIVENGPVYKEGTLKVGDIITGYSDDGENFTLFKGLSENKIIRAFRGEVGKKVYLSFTSRGKTGVANITREVVEFKQKQADRLEFKKIKNEESTLGYIKIPLFYDNFSKEDEFDVSSDVADLLSKNKNIDGLIIDLRSNGGGSLNAALKLLDLFLSEKILLQVKYFQGKPNILQSDKNPNIFDKPLIVYIDGLSASASEIFAGVIQDYGRGIIIGSPSYGKGTVQSIFDLNLGQIKVTTAQFFLPSGRSTQEKGITPDIIFPTQYPTSIFGEVSMNEHIPYAESFNLLKEEYQTQKKINKFNIDLSSKGLDHLQSYYNLINKFEYGIKKVPLNLILREEELEHFYQSEIAILNKYFKANNLPIIKNKVELLERGVNINLDDQLNSVAFKVFKFL